MDFLRNNRAAVLWASAFVIGNFNHSLIHAIRSKETTEAKEKGINFIKWFAPKNESIWEHIKMAYFPLLLLTLLFDRNINWGARIAGLWVHIFWILIIYYIVVEFTCKDILWFNIILFASACYVGYKAERSLQNNKRLLWPGIILTVMVVLLSYCEHPWNPTPKGAWVLSNSEFFRKDMFIDKKANHGFHCRRCPRDKLYCKDGTCRDKCPSV